MSSDDPTTFHPTALTLEYTSPSLKDSSCRVHAVVPNMHATFKSIFPALKQLDCSDLKVLVVWMKTENDMSGYSGETQDERDLKTAVVCFFAFYI